MSDSVLRHTGPISLTDTPLEPSICRTLSHHATEKFPEMKKATEETTRMDSLNFPMEAPWAGSRETLSTSGRRRSFFLTSLFIELTDCVQIEFN
jgi:hypothetical protein